MSDLIRRLQLLERDAKSELTLTLPQAHALHALRAAGQLRMQELAMCLGLAQSTVTRLVAPLKRMGLLDRRPDRGDGRATVAFLTPAGDEMAQRIDGVDGDLYEEILARLTPGGRVEVEMAIAKLHDAVIDMGEDALRS